MVNLLYYKQWSLKNKYILTISLKPQFCKKVFHIFTISGIIHGNTGDSMIKKIILSENEPSFSDLFNFLYEDLSGANFVFFGRVKDEIDSKKVKHMVCEPDPFKVEEEIHEFLKNYERELNRVYYYHRIGKIPPGKELFVLGVSSNDRFISHRATIEIIDFTKELFKHSEKDIFI